MSELGTGRQRQADIYLGALSGARRRVPVDPAGLEEGAPERVTPEAPTGTVREGACRRARPTCRAWKSSPTSTSLWVSPAVLRSTRSRPSRSWRT